MTRCSSFGWWAILLRQIFVSPNLLPMVSICSLRIHSLSTLALFSRVYSSKSPQLLLRLVFLPVFGDKKCPRHGSSCAWFAPVTIIGLHSSSLCVFFVCLTVYVFVSFCSVLRTLYKSPTCFLVSASVFTFFLDYRRCFSLVFYTCSLLRYCCFLWFLVMAFASLIKYWYDF